MFFLGCHTKSQIIIDKNSLKDYRNDELKITLKYPSYWKADTSLAYLGNQPSQYSGEDGFFALNILVDNNQDLEILVNKEAESGDYGLTPRIEKTIHNSKVCYYIFPSSDQSSSENKRCCFITELRTIYRDNGINYNILIIFADKGHIQKIIDTLEYLYI